MCTYMLESSFWTGLPALTEFHTAAVLLVAILAAHHLHFTASNNSALVSRTCAESATLTRLI
jgi:hypothetical protein